MAIRNLDRLQSKLARIPRELQKPIEAALLASAAEMNSHAIVQIQTNSGTGRKYRRGSRVHIASSPGEFPNTDYGELVRNMFFRLEGYLTAIWGNSSKHARPLEFGTSRMAARPFIQPTRTLLRYKVRDRVAEAVKTALKAGVRG